MLLKEFDIDKLFLLLKFLKITYYPEGNLRILKI